MKKILISLLFTLTGFMTYAQTQTGIGTAAPAQALHVTAGATSSTTLKTTLTGDAIKLVTPTVRIDGLNKTNNTVASASSSLVQAVSATQDGDFILSPEFAVPLVAATLGTDMITTITLNNPSGSLFASTTLKSYTFTLAQTSLVHILSSISVSALNSSDNILTDNANRICGVEYEFSAAPTGVSTGTYFGDDGYNYTNGGNSGVSGKIYVQPEAYMVLPKGTYTLLVRGWTYVEQWPMHARFGEAADDMVSVTAFPL